MPEPQRNPLTSTQNRVLRASSFISTVIETQYYAPDLHVNLLRNEAEKGLNRPFENRGLRGKMEEKTCDTVDFISYNSGGVYEHIYRVGKRCLTSKDAYALFQAENKRGEEWR